MTFSAADRKDIRRAEKAARQVERERQDVMIGIMSSTSGRKWVHDFLASCQCFTTTFQPDPLGMAFAEGRRAVGLQVLADVMQACPDLYTLMMREANERTITDAVRANRDADNPTTAAELPRGPESGREFEGRGAVDYDPLNAER